MLDPGDRRVVSENDATCRAVAVCGHRRQYLFGPGSGVVAFEFPDARVHAAVLQLGDRCRGEAGTNVAVVGVGPPPSAIWSDVGGTSSSNSQRRSSRAAQSDTAFRRDS